MLSIEHWGEKGQNIHSSSTCGILFKIDHIPGHRTSLIKFKRIEIIISISSDYNIMKLEINHREKWKKNNYMETKQHVTKKSSESMIKLLNQRGNQKIPRDKLK